MDRTFYFRSIYISRVLGTGINFVTGFFMAPVTVILSANVVGDDTGPLDILDLEPSFNPDGLVGTEVHPMASNTGKDDINPISSNLDSSIMLVRINVRVNII